MFVQASRKDENVIKINHNMTFSNLLSEDLVHHHLEGSWRVREAKKYDTWFKKAMIRFEGSFPFIPRMDPYIVVSPSYVELRENHSILQFVDQV